MSFSLWTPLFDKGDICMQVVKYAFQQHGDDRGQLIALEEL